MPEGSSAVRPTNGLYLLPLFGVLKYMISGTKEMLIMFCYIFTEHKYSNGTVLILCTATVSVCIHLVYLTSLSRSCASSHLTESACETCLDYALNSSDRDVADTVGDCTMNVACLCLE